MKNNPLRALWGIAAAAFFFGLLLTFLGSVADSAYAGANYSLWGSSLMSIGLMCTLGALIAMAIGAYIRIAAARLAEPASIFGRGSTAPPTGMVAAAVPAPAGRPEPQSPLNWSND